MADQKKKPWTKEESKLWDNSAEAVDRMPIEMRIKFAESLEAIAVDARQEPEDERLERMIESDLIKLKEAWVNFEPGEWDIVAFYQLCNACEKTRRMIEDLNHIIEMEAEFAARE